MVGKRCQRGLALWHVSPSAGWSGPGCNSSQSFLSVERPRRSHPVLRSVDGSTSLCPHSARAAALVHLLPPLQRSGRARQSCAGCLVRRTGRRIRLRVDHSRPRLRPVYGSSLASAFLTGEVPLTVATALCAVLGRGGPSDV